MKIDLHEEIEVPEKVQVSINEAITLKGPKGEVKRKFSAVNVKAEGKRIIIESKGATKREKKNLYTLAAHIKNMIKGVTEGHFYELKMCSAHFPMNVTMAGNEFTVKNFLGENHPRKFTVDAGVSVKINGNIIRVESADIEAAGRTASRIELLTNVRNRDRRIFQDGIFIINKDGIELK